MPVNMPSAAAKLYGKPQDKDNSIFTTADYIKELAEREEQEGKEGVLTDGWIADKMRSDPQFFGAAMRNVYQWGKNGVEYDPNEPDLATGTAYSAWFARAYEAGKRNEPEPDFESWFDEANGGQANGGQANGGQASSP